MKDKIIIMTKPKKSSKVRARNREYAFTKEEALKGYNDKIDRHIERLISEVEFHRNNKL